MGNIDNYALMGYGNTGHHYVDIGTSTAHPGSTTIFMGGLQNLEWHPRQFKTADVQDVYKYKQAVKAQAQQRGWGRDLLI